MTDSVRLRVFCCERVSDGRASVHQCSRRAVATVKGKPYCSQHHPENVAKRRGVTFAKYDEQMSVISRRVRRLQDYELLREALRSVASTRPTMTAVAKASHLLARIDTDEREGR